MMSIDTFGGWIKARRKKLDLTQESLAQRIGCSLSAIRKIENDERRPSRQIAELLALHLEVPPEERTLFLKVARGESSIQRLNTASPRPEAWVAVAESSSPPSNIPASTFPFIGRQQESESLARMLTDPRQRLITILGPGGIGKTRLAMEVAGTQLSTFDEHVYFIQLAAINTVDSILPAIAAILKIPSTNTEELKIRLIDTLRDKKVLLVLDNFEHLIDGAPLLSEFLQKMPFLKLLVTSRERLNLLGEWTFELGGLTFPPQADEGKAEYSALQLFESHTQRIRADLKLVGAEREAAIRICQHVDGMPLAIELAAAWVNILSCEEIAHEIEGDFDFLSSTLQDIPERHRSLRAAFEHSWKRLTDSEQTALSRLTIFQGGFNLEAAEAVVGADRTVLSSLVSKSLLRRSPRGRFDLHEVIRQFSLDQLKDKIDLQDRHARYYLSLLQKEEATPIGMESDIDRLRGLAEEYGNIHVAWDHAIKNRMYEDIDKVLDNAWLIYAINGWFQEGIEQTIALARCLQGNAETRSEKMLLARALMSANGFLARAGEYLEANRLFEESSEILRSVGDTEYLANVLIAHGKVLCVMGKLSLAHEKIGEGIQLAIKDKNDWVLGLGYVNHGYVFAQEENYQRALELICSGLSMYKEIKNLHGVAFALNTLGTILIQLERFDEARESLEESLALNIQFQDRWGMGMAYGRLGMLSLQTRELSNARSFLQKSLAMFTELGMRWDTGWALMQLGKVAMASEEWLEAEQLLKRSIKLSLASQAMPQVIEAALELADWLIYQKEFYKAVELFQSAVNHPAITGSAKHRAQELKAVLEQKVDIGNPTSETLETVLARFAV